MDFFNVEIVAILEQELDKIFPLRFCAFEINGAPCRVDGQLRA
jgi:hypothetical protein